MFCWNKIDKSINAGRMTYEGIHVSLCCCTIQASNLAEANASEDDKIKAAIKQSTNEYDPSKWVYFW